MEENKVREKLARIICHKYLVTDNPAAVVPVTEFISGLIADRLLQSPDLRVTLVEARCDSAWSSGGKTYYCVEQKGHEGSHHD